MLVILEVISGPSAGARLEIKPGKLALVGRAKWAEMSLPRDMSMAGQHFSLECGLQRCTLRVLDAAKPVFLNETKVGQELLKDGDIIQAGDNTFRVRIEGAEAAPSGPVSVAAPAGSAPLPPPAVKEPEPKPVVTPKRDVPQKAVDLLETLRQAQPLYALLDAARDEQVLDLLEKSGEEYECLYEGAPAEELAVVAPYLVRLPPQSKLLDTLVREGWGKSWGVYLTSQQPLKEVRKHFRHFLKVESEGEEYLFRFYDPRVLRAFLPVCNAEETRQFFGPVDCYLMETFEPAFLLHYAATLQGVKEQVVPLFIA
jgi:hypothetical protein